jgi:hypothetical protein
MVIGGIRDEITPCAILATNNLNLRPLNGGLLVIRSFELVR